MGRTLTLSMALALAGCAGTTTLGSDVGKDASSTSAGLDASAPGIDASQPGSDASTPLDAAVPADASLPDSGCAAGAVCPEDCLDTAAVLPRLYIKVTDRVTYTGAFFNNTFSTEARRCQWTTIDEHCSYYDCFAADFSGDAGVLRGPSVGTISATAPGGFDFELTPGENGIYNGERLNILPSAGTEFTIHAAGDEVPQFSVDVALPSPLEIAVTSPSIPDGGVAEFDRSSPATFTWTPSDAKVCLAVFQTGTTDTWDFDEAMCIYDGSAGEGTIPAAVLGHLKAGAVPGTVAAVKFNRTCVSVGGYHIEGEGVGLATSWSVDSFR